MAVRAYLIAKSTPDRYHRTHTLSSKRPNGSEKQLTFRYSKESSEAKDKATFEFAVFSAKSGHCLWISSLKFGIWTLISTTAQCAMKDKTDLSLD